jgi:hypothetical protein
MIDDQEDANGVANQFHKWFDAIFTSVKSLNHYNCKVVLTPFLQV